MKPTLTLLAGPNGAGKSYFSNFFVEAGFISTLPINIDALEERVDKSRLPDDAMRFERKLREEIDKVFNELCREAIDNKRDFAYECNLRLDQVYCVNSFEKAGYRINIIYIWLDSIEISEQRVQVRVSEGGHLVGLESIKTNYYEGLKNFDPSVSEGNWDHVYLIDNSKDVKSKGDPLSLLLEMNDHQIVHCSDNFFASQRQKLLPGICNLIERKKTF